MCAIRKLKEMDDDLIHADCAHFEEFEINICRLRDDMTHLFPEPTVGGLIDL